jgi:hypothetical protein
MKTNLLGLIACVSPIGVSQARATNIEYHVDAVCRLNAPSGLMSVKGTIITKRQFTMPLTKSDIISWQLTIKNAYGVSTLSSSLPGSNVEVLGPICDLA